MSAKLSQPITLHYRHDGVIVTNRHFVSSEIRCNIRELSALAQARGPLHPGVRIGLGTAVAELLVLVPVLFIFGSLTTLAIALPALLIPCLASAMCARRWPPELALLAQYRGRTVTLYTTADQQRFGQVSRALLRAMEK